MSYREITKKELNHILFEREDVRKYDEAILLMKTHYPPAAVEIYIITESVYNDNTYDEKVSCIIVNDAEGNELSPTDSGKDDDSYVSEFADELSEPFPEGHYNINTPPPQPAKLFIEVPDAK